MQPKQNLTDHILDYFGQDCDYIDPDPLVNLRYQLECLSSPKLVTLRQRADSLVHGGFLLVYYKEIRGFLELNDSPLCNDEVWDIYVSAVVDEIVRLLPNEEQLP